MGAPSATRSTNIGGGNGVAVMATGEGGALVDEAVEGVPGAGADAGAVAERPATKWEHGYG